MDNIYYAICSVIYMMVAKLKGVSFSLFFCCGRLSIERKRTRQLPSVTKHVSCQNGGVIALE